MCRFHIYIYHLVWYAEPVGHKSGRSVAYGILLIISLVFLLCNKQCSEKARVSFRNRWTRYNIRCLFVLDNEFFDLFVSKCLERI